MGKKHIRKTKTSKGQRPSVSSTVKVVSDVYTKEMNKLNAWIRGQNPWITVPGPDTKHAWVKKRANDLWGSPKNRIFNTQTQTLNPRKR